MLELAAASGEIELKYREGVRLLYVEPSELYLLPTWAAKTSGTNSATRQETEYFGANATLHQFCLWSSPWGVYKPVLYKNAGTAGTASIRTPGKNRMHHAQSSKTMVRSTLVPRYSSAGRNGKSRDSTSSFCPNTVLR